MKDVNKKMSEYENSIQMYSDLCDQVKADQTETDLNVNDLYEKVDTLQSMIYTKKLTLCNLRMKC